MALCALATAQNPIYAASPDYGALSAEELRPLADNGDPIAQALLGAAHELGDGVPRDADLAIAWYRKAAGQGIAMARERLPKLLETRGGAADLREAFDIYAVEAQREADKPDGKRTVVAELLSHMADISVRQGNHEPAVTSYRQVLKVFIEEYGDLDARVWEVRDAIVASLLELGRPADAAPELVEMFTVYKHVLERGSADYSATLKSLLADTFDKMLKSGRVQGLFDDELRFIANLYRDEKAARSNAGAPSRFEEMVELSHREEVHEISEISMTGNLDRLEAFIGNHLQWVGIVFGEESAQFADSLGDIGWEYKSLGDHIRSVQYFERQLAVLEKTLEPGDPRFISYYRDLAANYYRLFGLNDEAKAAEYSARAAAIASRNISGTPLERAKQFERLASDYFNTNQPSKRIAALGSALDLRMAELGEDHAATLNTQLLLAAALRNSGDEARAEALLARARNVRVPVVSGDFFTELQFLAMSFDALGDDAQAEHIYKQRIAEDERRRGENSLTFSSSIESLAEFYRKKGRYRDAEREYFRSLKHQENASRSDPEGIGTTLISIAETYREQALYADAERVLNRVIDIDIATQGENGPYVLETREILAGLYQDQGKLEDAEAVHRLVQKALRTRLDPEHKDIGRSLFNLASNLFQQGRIAEAETTLDEAADIIEKRAPDLVPLVNHLRARIAGSKGDFDTAIAQINGNLDAWSFTDTASAEIHLHLGQALEGAGRLSEAHARYGEAFQLLRRSARTGDPSRRGLDRTAGRLEREILDGLLRAAWQLRTGKGEDDGATFETGQHATRGGVAAVVMQMAARSQLASPELSEALREWQDLAARHSELKLEQVRLVTQPAATRDREKIAAVDEALTEKQRRIAELQDELRNSAPNFAELAAPPTLSPADVHALLKTGEALVQFVFTDAAGYAWFIPKSAEGVRWVRLDATRASIRAQVTRLRANLDPSGAKGARGVFTPQPDARGTVMFDLQTAYELFDVLFGQLRSELASVQHLIIVADGALQTLPAAVLVTAPPTAETTVKAAPWLIRSHALSVLPAVSSLAALRKFATTPAADRLPFAGFGDPRIGGEAPPEVRTVARAGQPAEPFRGVFDDVHTLRELTALPESADELKRIAAALGADQGAVYLGENATERAVKTAELRNRRVLAFATHGLVTGELKGLDEPALVLTPPDEASARDDGLLKASEIAALRLDADWVILSACNTASSAGGSDGEGLSGLAKSFFYAGARSLLVSHWPVYSSAAVDLTTGLFDELNRTPGLGRAEAFRRSVLRLIESGTEWESHPSYWAPFVVVGEGG